MVVTNQRGGLRTLPDALAMKTRGVRSTYEREIVCGFKVEVQIGEHSKELTSPPAENLTAWTPTGRGGVRLRPDPIALKTRGIKTTYEVRDKGGCTILINSVGEGIVMENPKIEPVVMEE